MSRQHPQLFAYPGPWASLAAAPIVLVAAWSGDFFLSVVGAASALIGGLLSLQELVSMLIRLTHTPTRY